MVTQTPSLRLRHHRHNVKVHSHRVKANIFSDVCRLFFDLFAFTLTFVWCEQTFEADVEIETNANVTCERTLDKGMFSTQLVSIKEVKYTTTKYRHSYNKINKCLQVVDCFLLFGFVC